MVRNDQKAYPKHFRKTIKSHPKAVLQAIPYGAAFTVCFNDAVRYYKQLLDENSNRATAIKLSRGVLRVLREAHANRITNAG